MKIIKYTRLVPGKFYRDVLPENDKSGTGQTILQFIDAINDGGLGPQIYRFKPIKNYDYYSPRINGNFLSFFHNPYTEWYYYPEDNNDFKFGK